MLSLLGTMTGLAAFAARRGPLAPMGAAAPRLMRLLFTGLVAMSASLVLKMMIGRARPGAGPDPLAFAPGALDRAFQSLPSSSSAVAAALAVGLARWRPSLTAPAVAALIAICAERVLSRSHWPSDVIAGVVLGLVAVRWVQPGKREAGR
jgi:membrane-associated phospholipid phosphatase